MNAAASRHQVASAVLRASTVLTVASALATLCSCRSIVPVQKLTAEDVPRPRRSVERSIAGATESQASVPRECDQQTTLPIPVCNVPSWSPPGIAGPWPHDEYLLDGGDRDIQANIGPEGEVNGLELDDTVAVYDTPDGRTCIEPSNRVCLYAPRFAAVRKVTSVVAAEQRDQPIGVAAPLSPYLHQDNQLANAAVQPIRPEGEIGRKQPSIEQTNEVAIPAIARQPIAAMGSGFSPHENFDVIRRGIVDLADKPRLIEAIDAAITWSHDKAVQVILDGKQAVSLTGDQSAQQEFRVEVPNHPCLRVIKVASTKVARPGDTVEFTIRFDNTGDQAIEHVTLIDNLTTRLEYVEDTAQSSRDSEFFTETNEGDSLVLRWEFKDPLPVGAGGLVRFNCRVR
jgi:uncharacterized repeat protein (TIGR01451 family)